MWFEARWLGPALAFEHAAEVQVVGEVVMGNFVRRYTIFGDVLSVLKGCVSAMSK